MRNLNTYPLVKRVALEIHEVFVLDPKGLRCHFKLVIQALVSNLLKDVPFGSMLWEAFCMHDFQLIPHDVKFHKLSLNEVIKLLNGLVILVLDRDFH